MADIRNWRHVSYFAERLNRKMVERSIPYAAAEDGSPLVGKLNAKYLQMRIICIMFATEK